METTSHRQTDRHRRHHNCCDSLRVCPFSSWERALYPARRRNGDHRPPRKAHCPAHRAAERVPARGALPRGTPAISQTRAEPLLPPTGHPRSYRRKRGGRRRIPLRSLKRSASEAPPTGERRPAGRDSFSCPRKNQRSRRFAPARRQRTRRNLLWRKNPLRGGSPWKYQRTWRPFDAGASAADYG